MSGGVVYLGPGATMSCRKCGGPTPPVTLADGSIIVSCRACYPEVYERFGAPRKDPK